MLRHIVMWKFNEGVDKQVIGEEIKSSLLDLCKSMDEVVKADCSDILFVKYNNINLGAYI